MAYTTHVSNGSDNDIYVICVTDRTKLKPIPKFVDDFQEFQKIPSGKFEPFRTGSILSQPVFITAFSYDASTEKVTKICEAFEVPSDHSVVIGSDNQIHRVEYGRLWIDLDGKNHFLDY